MILFAFPSFKTPFLAALSTAEKALLSESRLRSDLKLSMALFALVLVALLKVAFFLSDLSFFIADLVNGILAPILPQMASISLATELK